MPSRPLARTALALALALAPASAAAQEPTPEKVNVRITDQQIDYGNLHISFNVLGYQLSDPDAGFVTSLQGVFELGDALMVRAHLVTPLLFGVASSHAPVRLEAGAGFHRTTVDLEHESVTLESTRSGDMIHTKSVKIPVANRNSRGLGAGLILRDNPTEYEVDGDRFEGRSTHLTAYAGLSVLNSAGYSLDVEGYKASFFNYRWMNAGLDVLFDVVQSFDAEPDDAGRFGARLWAESIFGKRAGLSGRLEIGYFPGETGFYMLASFGGGLHLGL